MDKWIDITWLPILNYVESLQKLNQLKCEHIETLADSNGSINGNNCYASGSF